MIVYMRLDKEVEELTEHVFDLRNENQELADDRAELEEKLKQYEE